jgi:hypothetical protein
MPLLHSAFCLPALQQDLAPAAGLVQIWLSGQHSPLMLHSSSSSSRSLNLQHQ